MRVLMGEVIDVKKDFTMRSLTISQKVSAIIGAAIADSKILGKRKKDREELELRKRGELIDSLKDGILAVVQYHLKDNRTLSAYNQKAQAIEIALDREHEGVLSQILDSKEFNLLEVEFVALDPDLVNSFGVAVPVILRISRKEV